VEVEGLGPLAFVPEKSLTPFDVHRALRNLRTFQSLDRRIAELGFKLERAQEEVDRQQKKLDELSEESDHFKGEGELTESPKREYSLRRIDEAIHMAQRYEVPLACLLVGIDNHATIKEHLGASFAEAVLAQIAGRLRRSLRNTDLLTLFGNDEFLVLSPFTTSKGAQALARRLCDRIEEQPVAYKDRVLQPTVSIGIARFRPAMTGPDALMELAAEALAKARSKSEDRIELL
jgi:diguanylate cyclase (GGDEF)-like protein